MLAGLFARADHPQGWGMGAGRAHGYSLVCVMCTDSEQLDQVQAVMRDFRGIEAAQSYRDGLLGDWYGGQFDLAAVLDGEHLRVHPGGREGQPYASLGDNRYVGVFDAETVLAAKDLVAS